jgi:hypothetical protein
MPVASPRSQVVPSDLVLGHRAVHCLTQQRPG